MESIYIKSIEASLRSIRLKTKKPSETNIGYALNKLKEVNAGLYEDHMNEYKTVLANLAK